MYDIFGSFNNNYPCCYASQCLNNNEYHSNCVGCSRVNFSADNLYTIDMRKKQELEEKVQHKTMLEEAEYEKAKNVIKKFENK